MNPSYKGKILISTPDISGDIFSRSVVLVIEHNADGAFGLILNKKSPTVSLRLLEILGIEIPVYEGGPVEQDKILFLLKNNSIVENFVEISEGYYFTQEIDAVISALIDHKISPGEIKVLSGYSGWSAKQLDSEVQQKMWTVIDVYNLDYTQENDQNLWKNMMEKLGGEFLLFANSPEDVSMN